MRLKRSGHFLTCVQNGRNFFAVRYRISNWHKCLLSFYGPFNILLGCSKPNINLTGCDEKYTRFEKDLYWELVNQNLLDAGTCISCNIPLDIYGTHSFPKFCGRMAGSIQYLYPKNPTPMRCRKVKCTYRKTPGILCLTHWGLAA